MAGYDFTLSACEGPGPEHYAAVLLNDPDLEELLGTEAWLRGAPVSQVSRPVQHAPAQHGAFRRPDPACECSPRRPYHRLLGLAQHASAQHGAFPSQVAEFVNSQPSGTAALSTLLAGLCRYSERSPSDNQRIEIAMRCLKALIRTDKGLAGVITSPALVCQAFASGGGS